MAIRFLSTIEEWKDFSNLSLHPIEMEGDRWNSVEHYYQYKKFETSDLEFAIKLKNLESPLEVKKMSLKNDNYPLEWNYVKEGVLRSAVKKKFNTYPELSHLLDSTDEEYLIEANEDDPFWGEGKDGKGKNMMGKILMDVRDELRCEK